METIHTSDLNELYELAAACDAGLSLPAFSNALTDLGKRFLPADATRRQALRFFRSLHLKDFALAQSCSMGNPIAWERFIDRYKSRLYTAAIAIAKNEHAAKELADSLAGDLYAGKAASLEGLLPKLATYSGRGSLEAWLKAILVHKYIDRYRSQRRLVSLEHHADILRNLFVSQEAYSEEIDCRVNAAIEEAFLKQPPEKRILLTAYFFDNWTLAEIAAALAIHESSVSRRINRVLQELRRAIHRDLQKKGMSPTEIQQSFQTSRWEVSFDLRGLLLRGLARE
jgi:RNA polymerase sigma-70 factor (ECF subfamily)